MSDFKQRYNQLEHEVHCELINMINESGHNSKFIHDCKAIDLENHIFSSEYIELVFLHDRLVLNDYQGYQYSITVVELEELINLIEQLK